MSQYKSSENHHASHTAGWMDGQIERGKEMDREQIKKTKEGEK